MHHLVVCSLLAFKGCRIYPPIILSTKNYEGTTVEKPGTSYNGPTRVKVASVGGVINWAFASGWQIELSNRTWASIKTFQSLCTLHIPSSPNKIRLSVAVKPYIPYPAIVSWLDQKITNFGWRRSQIDTDKVVEINIFDVHIWVQLRRSLLVNPWY